MNKTKFLQDARKGMSLKLVRKSKAPSPYGLDKWHKITKVTSKYVKMGPSSLRLPDTKYMDYNGRELIIYRENNPEEINMRYIVGFFK